jgi:hypothetical protein
MLETRKVSKSSKADTETESKKAEGYRQRHCRKRAHILSAFCYLSVTRLFLSFDFLKICVNHIIISRFC